ncbi:hypothetical protein [Mycolicibacterium sp.]|uniref:hypothetical protein n=1 Tax=Mycolicibacterium sp. TaxID=2320850 RepID=UPI0037CBC81C
MRYIGIHRAGGVVELTRRNLQTLLAKLDDPLSLRALVDPDDNILIRAVESSDVRGGPAAQAALAAEGVVELTRDELQVLVAALDNPPASTAERSVVQGAITVRAVDDDAHYRNRVPGAVWMPSSGEFT